MAPEVVPMHRPVRVLLVLVVALVATSSPAFADPPFQERISDPVTALLPGSDFCGFDVLAEVEQKFKFIAFSGNRGTWVSAKTVGKIKVVLTNLETGESLALSIPGPGFIDAEQGLLVGTGPWVVFVPGQLLYLVGRITFEPGPFGVQPAEVRGRSIDLCEVLA
jgi:hypothetical protein